MTRILAHGAVRRGWSRCCSCGDAQPVWPYAGRRSWRCRRREPPASDSDGRVAHAYGGGDLSAIQGTVEVRRPLTLLKPEQKRPVKGKRKKKK